MAKPYSVFANYYDYLMEDVDYEAWVSRIVTQLKTYHPKARVLVDLACGTGNITNLLAKKGYLVTGIDLSEEMLMIAQDKAYEKNLRIQYIKQDMVRFATHKKADAITCICDGLNYLHTQEQLNHFFENASKQLNDEGLMVIDISSPYKYEHVLSKKTIAELDESVSFIWENHFDSDTQLLDFDIAFFVPEGSDGLYRRLLEHHTQKSHQFSELESAFKSTFELICHLDGETGEALKKDSERWLLVLRKRTI